MSLSGWIAGLSALVLMGGSAEAGSLEPPGPPGPTMKTLDEIPPAWSQVLPASERFVLVMGGDAVLDKETGLVWQRQPWDLGSFGLGETWTDASRGCHSLRLGGRMGWRLPTVEELLSLVDLTTGQAGQYLPAGHPFTQINTDDFRGYWTATTFGSALKYFMNLSLWVGTGCGGCVGSREFLAQVADESSGHHTWCVRGGQGVDPQ